MFQSAQRRIRSMVHQSAMGMGVMGRGGGVGGGRPGGSGGQKRGGGNIGPSADQ
jgi:hypothetical protein